MLIGLSVLLVAGCVDNSGGGPPAGDDVSLEVPGEIPGSPCPSLVAGGHEAALLDTPAAVEEWLAGCDPVDEDRRAALVSAVEDAGDKKLIAVRMVLGGCARDWSLMGLYHDDDVINVWVLVADTSHGVSGAACTDDIFWDEAFYYAAEGDFSAVQEAAILAGIYNPDLPGAPALPGG